MASVAREARVRITTLFRHFPAKKNLIAAVVADRMDAYAVDPWHGFTCYIEKPPARRLCPPPTWRCSAWPTPAW